MSSPTRRNRPPPLSNLIPSLWAVSGYTCRRSLLPLIEFFLGRGTIKALQTLSLPPFFSSTALFHVSYNGSSPYRYQLDRMRRFSFLVRTSLRSKDPPLNLHSCSGIVCFAVFFSPFPKIRLEAPPHPLTREPSRPDARTSTCASPIILLIPFTLPQSTPFTLNEHRRHNILRKSLFLLSKISQFDCHFPTFDKNRS